MPLYLGKEMISGISLGVPGAPGKSAYDATKEVGYTGTEQEFYHALKDVPGHIANEDNPHDVTAAQVGARPDTWMPSASDVGAYSKTETDTLLQKKAPAGYGLGEGTSKDFSDANDCVKNGFYRDNTGSALNTPFGFCHMLVTNFADTYVRQDAYVTGGSGTVQDTRHAVRTKHPDLGGWGEWEWDAGMPMQLGVEYRTTERYLGKPVYVKLVDCGASGSAGTTKTIAHNISNMKDVVDYGGSRNTSTGNAPESIPSGRESNLRTYVTISPSTIYIYTVDDNTAYTDTKVWIKYTKITD